MHYLEGQRLLIWHVGRKKIRLGDALSSVSSGIYVAQLNKLKKIQLAVAPGPNNSSIKFTKEMLGYIDYGDLEVSIVPASGEEEYSLRKELDKLGVPAVATLCFYDGTYPPPVIKRVSKAEVKKKICYCWDTIFRKKGVPNNIKDLEEVLRREFSEYEFVELGLPKTIEEDLRELSDCYFYIGFDSGIAHLCRFVRAPLFLLGGVGGFPEHACERKILEWKLKGNNWVSSSHEILDQIHDYLFDIYH